MSDQLLVQQLDPLTYSVVRSSLIQQLSSSDLAEVEANIVQEFHHWEHIGHPRVRRSAEQWGRIFDDAELTAYAKALLSYLQPFSEVTPPTGSSPEEPDGDSDIHGSQGFTEFFIGILIGLAANALYDAYKNAFGGDEKDPNCVSKVKMFVDGECFEWCVNQQGYITGEPEPCDGESE